MHWLLELEPLVVGSLPFPSSGTLTLKAELPVPSLFLVHICAQPKVPPDQITGLNIMSLTKRQVVIVWKYGSQFKEKAEVSGFYRMHAVDYWGRPGEYSLPEKYTEEHWNLSFLLKYII
ncbi:alpha-L-iduronidase-like [Polyodon spathula]|uniref:alpha-L-iduronidase-like n=1 Tax=Polyodon spathula TaxID=7913 RepID=UPI001B7F2481|nr:alpha-L-iduronidase-like [Polyodon spathula]